MRLARFSTNEGTFQGIIKGDRIDVYEGSMFGDRHETGTSYALSAVHLLAPVIPSKTVCVGHNYLDHFRETNAEVPVVPLIFMKPTTAVIGPGDEIVYPAMSRHIDYECELAIVIGKSAKLIPSADAKNYIFGYTCANDVTARDIQRSNGQWVAGKGFDTFLPLGPWIETEIDPDNLNIKTTVNGKVKQSSNTGNCIFDVSRLVEFVSSIMTLLPGDVIITGTPAGISKLEKGDVVTVEIEGIGALTNTVV
jgi:2-keto-4-pentenoate hydratase/2-oxohepta-3-ene-1,7-dioic acid hydratase in catechol pathway